jgi:transcription antitermination factor NusG
VEVFCPRLRLRRATKRGPVWFVEALFPGYLFARFDRWLFQKAVAYSRGVTTIVRFGDEIARVPDEAIAILRAQMGDAECRIIDPDLREGDRVVVAHGLFRGLSSIVTCVMPARDRVRILLEFLGECRDVELARDQVLPDGGHFLSA